jgi:hypothetical protein
MPHSRDEVPQKICSEKVKDHKSTSRDRSLAKRMIRLICHQGEKPLKHHTGISGIKPSCTQKVSRNQTLIQDKITNGMTDSNDQLEGPRLNKEVRSAHEKGTTTSWKKSRAPDLL